MGKGTNFARGNYLRILLVLTVLLTPVVRILREPPNHVALTVSSKAGLFAPNVNDLEGSPVLDLGHIEQVVSNLRMDRTYRLNVGQSTTVGGLNGSRVHVDRDHLQLELTFAGEGEADIKVSGFDAAVGAGEPISIDLPGQPSVLRNIVDSLVLASLIIFSGWAYGRRHIRGRPNLADTRGDEVRMSDTR